MPSRGVACIIDRGCSGVVDAGPVAGAPARRAS
jgi:hypothetical protein